MRNIFLIIALLNTLFLFGGSKEIGCMVIQPIETSCMEPPHEAFYFMETQEIWKDVAGYEGLYQVSNSGNVRSVDRIICQKSGKMHPHKGIYIKKVVCNIGYVRVAISKNAKSKMVCVHRLVAMAFIPNPENKPQVNHKDGDKQNNSILNLEWVTAKENIKHSYDYLGKSHPSGAHSSLSKKTYQYHPYGKLVMTYNSLSETKKYGFNHVAICNSINKHTCESQGYIWSHKSLTQSEVLNIKTKKQKPILEYSGKCPIAYYRNIEDAERLGKIKRWKIFKSLKTGQSINGNRLQYLKC